MGSMGTVIVSPNRYQVLNPNVIPQGFVNNREASELLLGSTNLDVNEYKIGHIKVGSSPSALSQEGRWRHVNSSSAVNQLCQSAESFCFLFRKIGAAKANLTGLGVARVRTKLRQSGVQSTGELSLGLHGPQNKNTRSQPESRSWIGPGHHGTCTGEVWG